MVHRPQALIVPIMRCPSAGPQAISPPEPYSGMADVAALWPARQDLVSNTVGQQSSGTPWPGEAPHNDLRDVARQAHCETRRADSAGPLVPRPVDNDGGYSGIGNHQTGEVGGWNCESTRLAGRRSVAGLVEAALCEQA